MEQTNAWWKEAVGYQIYPRSFYDSNNDGIGDLNGIREKLPYLVDLGIDFIWINPIYASPNVDNGYDISDYEAILDEFGTMEEFDLLLEEAHAHGIKIIMDLVINHSSDQHEWFIESKKSLDNPYRDYYIWADGTPDNQPPSKWESIFGGSIWAYDEETQQYYMHVFAKEQPDLNWENEALKNEVFAMIKRWLDKGIDGFRLDAISHIKKAPYQTKPANHPFDPFMNVPGIETHLEDLRDLFNQYDIMTVGEASGVSATQAPKWVGEDGYFNMIFEFDHISLWNKEETGNLDVVQLKHALATWQLALDGQGWNALYMENHDVPRSVSAFGNDTDYWQESAKAIALMYFFLQGTPFIYQGQEIGMTNYPYTSIDEIDAVDSRAFYFRLLEEGRTNEEALRIVGKTTRDNSRTPMQWTADKHAGFSKQKPWLLTNPNAVEINVDRQKDEAESILNFYKKLIAVRKNSDTLIYGSFTHYLAKHPQVFVYERSLADEHYLVVVNLTETPAVVEFPEEISTYHWTPILGNQTPGTSIEKIITLNPYEAQLFARGVAR
ncbi:glucohydrolase [Enterococcus sp. JM4C]|uniref:glycoside hydrolase family 13 protein n=1 Tax=Candidatus Enterococcus huntleyi TaxID=1857217 RepID=UPI001379B4EE|nr:alpha-glucosidase [Enterococcus sp. JM4C]KAF1296091.1 glucohydrolase [Enterococcus sp. JM4C]